MENLVTPSFWKSKKVFVTGHTGFKGSWMSYMLLQLGADVTGYSLLPPTIPSLFEIAALSKDINSIVGDIRDYSSLKKAFETARPEIVIHMAAQPIVRESYKDPKYTYETNVMGTVNILECIRLQDSVKSFLNVTTDKVYLNNEWEWGYREIDPLDGFDPYSNSKSCSELATHSYCSSFFKDKETAISTARAGNVIGGGDFACDRIIPDCIRAMQKKETIIVRNPHSTRPYQHVLEPVSAYLMITERQYNEKALAGWYNIGPDDCDCVTTGELVNIFCDAWGDNASWKSVCANGPHEANFLKLDCSKAKNVFHWQPRWHIKEAVQNTCDWSKAWLKKENVHSIMEKQINSYLQGENYNEK